MHMFVRMRRCITAHRSIGPPHRPLLLLLALCATAATARTLMSSSYCDWGGVDNSKYPWAKPRSERDWYCGNTALFNSEAEGAAGSGQVQ